MTDHPTVSEDWPPAGCPPLAWPALPTQKLRVDWYRSCVEAYAALWEGHSSCPSISPASDSAIQALEARLGCELPPALRQYHLELSALSLAETLCSVDLGHTPIQPLTLAFPGLADVVEDNAALALADDLIVFGDYLGNGNMFCFHRRSSQVYYFDHDSGAPLTLFFPTVQDYLDALMIRSLSEVHEDDEGGEKLLIERFGEALVNKWLY